ncbi:hypothetical protein [Rufibacter roseus]|uniref:Uncharacterized protein n=1 Tax=Rufibacter roseus TaxID=1567108 RepID=A0ABW2DGV4_9BACT|nr:hypothetical protein [Rufibacter roseus]
MKALQKFIHITLVVALLLGTTGFRVSVKQCAGGKGATSISFFGEPSCCCGKKAETTKKNCSDVTCVMLRGAATQVNFNAPTQQIAKHEPKQVYATSSVSVFPKARTFSHKFPSVPMPPPMSGRHLGILYQTFLI